MIVTCDLRRAETIAACLRYRGVARKDVSAVMATIKSAQLRGSEECVAIVVNSIAELVICITKAMKMRREEEVEFDTGSVNNATTSKLSAVAIV